jgi:hypothetical protein
MIVFNEKAAGYPAAFYVFSYDALPQISTNIFPLVQ